MRIYRVTVGVEGGETRVLKVPSKTDIQAADAATPLMSEGESILSIHETDDDYQEVSEGARPPGTQTHPDRAV
ncbi:MAG: hypothetical protein H2038_14240 [Brevundimonas sp.]|jgi:hypothetical protein|uniref:hypothetical protein n=1 Tax=Brevundimonas sp. TaxID=1871086 RepID=UPI00182AE878|nr:hypothetical protein [Brevundimonas sp.]MBA4805807.1 hypothetical protein [Brevundimonas sp.]